MPGIAYNVLDGGTGHDEHLPGSIYTKVFELFQIDRWEDPNVGPLNATAVCHDGNEYTFPSKTPVTYYNGFQLSGSVSFAKAQQLWYRFVTEKLDSAKVRPWSNFGPAFEQAAYELYSEGTLTYAEYLKAVNASRAVGHRQAPYTIPNHGGSTLRQAALNKSGQVLLFYSRYSDNRIVYQRRVSGVWQSPVSFTSVAAKTYMGLDAYDLPDGSSRVIFKRYDTNDVLYIKVNADATVPNVVYAFACAPTATNAPAGIHDGTRELIISSSASGISLMKMDTCAVVNTNYLNALKAGVSVTKHRGEVYLIGTGTAASTYSNRQIVFWLKQSNYLFYNFSNLYAGTLTCADYSNPNDCFSWSQSGSHTPNLYAVTMPPGREEFQRMYVAFTNSTSSFRLTRLDVRLDGAAHHQTKKTRFLPVDSDGSGNYKELEFVQVSDYMFIFENNRMHMIKLY